MTKKQKEDNDSIRFMTYHIFQKGGSRVAQVTPDGCVFFLFENSGNRALSGKFTANELRYIADELDKLNAQ